MTSSMLALGLAIAAWCAFSLAPRNGPVTRRILSLLAIPAGASLAVFRAQFDNVSVQGNVRALTILLALILLVTCGKPALMFDVGDPEENDQDQGSDDAEASARYASRVAQTQVLVVIIVILGVIAYEVSGLTFLD